MKRVYSSTDPMMVGHIKNILESEGISCLIKNQILSGGMGELPPLECGPEVWIRLDEDLLQSERIVTAALSDSVVDVKSWQCDCGEEIEGQFSACWQCGNERPL